MHNGNTMLEEEETLWSANRTTWKLPAKNPWSSDLGVLLNFKFVYSEIIYSSICPANTIKERICCELWTYGQGAISDDHVGRFKGNNRNCCSIEDWGINHESIA